MSANTYTLYGWHLSYYTGKLRCYLSYKSIPFKDKPVDLLSLTVRIKRQTGATVMPVLLTPDGEWLQDSSAIIDHLETEFPEPSVLPTDPVQRFAAYLLETWCDESWIPAAMHTRWSYRENYPLFERDAGSALLPGFPTFMQNRAVAKIANTLQAYLPGVGVIPDQFDMIETSLVSILDALDAHFAAHDYLLGARPSIADFGLAGPIYGHLNRDPWPKRELIDPRPHLSAWATRITGATNNQDARWLADDQIAPTLDPVFGAIAAEFLPMTKAILVETLKIADKFPPGRSFPRSLDPIRYPMGPGQFERRAMPFVLWKVQRLLDVYNDMDLADRRAVRDWLKAIGGEGLLELDIPRLRRDGLRVGLA
jgi:glutathione S-transferase